MKKIPVLFEQLWRNNKYEGIINKYNPAIKDYFENNTDKIVATVKYDGSACAIIGGELYKRYDNKNGKPLPKGAIQCQEHCDAITGHMPYWIPIDENDPADKYFIEGHRRAMTTTNEWEGFKNTLPDWTYELLGEKVQGNPYKLEKHIIYPHGLYRISSDDLKDYSYESLKYLLSTTDIEGVVFWTTTDEGFLKEPIAKIRKKDFGLKWEGVKRL